MNETTVRPDQGAVPSRRRKGRTWVKAAVPLSLVASGALVWGASNAAFTATTDNNGNSWTAGTVVLTDSDSGTAMFSTSNVQPGYTETHCIQVNYNGSLASNVKFYGAQDAAPVNRELYPYLNLVVERGTGTVGASNSCTSFTSQASVFSGTLDTLTASDYATGLGSYGMTTGTSTVYRVVASMPAGTGNVAQNKAAVFNFIWEAQNT